VERCLASSVAKAMEDKCEADGVCLLVGGRGSRRTERLSEEKPRTLIPMVNEAERRADLSDVASPFLKHRCQRAQRSRSRGPGIDPGSARLTT
jgi:hypothetical protein